jgi:hypothetical protein
MNMCIVTSRDKVHGNRTNNWIDGQPCPFCNGPLKDSGFVNTPKGKVRIVTCRKCGREIMRTTLTKKRE